MCADLLSLFELRVSGGLQGVHVCRRLCLCGCLHAVRWRACACARLLGGKGVNLLILARWWVGQEIPVFVCVCSWIRF